MTPIATQRKGAISFSTNSADRCCVRCRAICQQIVNTTFSAENAATIAVMPNGERLSVKPICRIIIRAMQTRSMSLRPLVMIKF